MRRLGVLALLSVVLATGCGKGGTSSAGTPAGNQSHFPPPTSTTTSTTTSAGTACFFRGLSEGLPVSEIDSQCQLNALIADIAASVRLRQSIANAFNTVSPGFGMTAANVVQWGERACREGPGVVNQLVARVSPTPMQRRSLLSPLLDFASDTASSCPSRPGIEDELASTAWSTAAGPAPSVATAMEVLRSQTQPPQAMAELFNHAHSPCGVVGNGAVIGLRGWSNVNLPHWAELAVGAFVGAVCGGLVDKLR